VLVGGALAQQAREVLGAQVALAAVALEGDAAVALPAAQRVDAQAERRGGGADADHVVHARTVPGSPRLRDLIQS
jgi:hypothetical protein